MGDHGSVWLAQGGAAPSGEYPTQDKSQIKQWLDGADPFLLDSEGQTYLNASSKVQQAYTALETHAPKIAAIWKGPDANKAKEALELLHATGKELSDALQKMGSQLSTYAQHLTLAQAKVNEEQKVPAGTEDADTVKKIMEDIHARRTMHELNEKIVEVYNAAPKYLNYNLPTVSIPGGPPTTTNPNYPSGSPYTTSGSGYDGSGGGNYGGSGGSGGSGSGGSGSGGGSNPGGSDPGGTNPGGTNPGGTNPGGSDPGGSDPGNSDPGGPGGPGQGTPADPGQTQPPTTTNPGDGTVPAVIGDRDTTTTTGGPTSTDPRQTDMASYRPPVVPTTPTLPTTMTPPPTTLTPTPGYGMPTPVGGTPGIPSVIGSPGVGGAHPALAGPGSVRAGGLGPGGMPMMPFMGGAGGGGEYSDLERNTYMPEDSSNWTSGHETTDPVIG